MNDGAAVQDLVVEESLVAYLATCSGVRDLVGNRIYPEVAPQEARPPFLVYTVTTDADELLLDGACAAPVATIQLDCWGEAGKQGLLRAKRLYRALWNALHGFSGQMGDHWIDSAEMTGRSDQGDAPQSGRDTKDSRVMAEVKLCYEDAPPNLGVEASTFSAYPRLTTVAALTGGVVPITIERHGSTRGAVTVSFDTYDTFGNFTGQRGVYTALPGTDYTVPDGAIQSNDGSTVTGYEGGLPLVFADGESSKTIPITVTANADQPFARRIPLCIRRVTSGAIAPPLTACVQTYFGEAHAAISITPSLPAVDYDEFLMPDVEGSLAALARGGAWTQHSGTWQHHDGGLICDATGVVTTAGRGNANDTVQGRLTDDLNYGLVFRAAALAATYLYVRLIDASGLKARLYYYDGALHNLLAQAAVTVSASGAYVVRVALSGTSIIVTVNGVAVITTTSASNQTASRAGVVSLGGAGDGFDDFAILPSS